MATPALCAFLLAAGIGACQSSERTAQAPPGEQQFTITLNRGDNGAAAQASEAKTQRRLAPPRRLAFEMAGWTKLPENGASGEQRAAAVQAAIIDAFCKALLSARRSRGQPDTDFTAELGPRLTVTYCTLDDGYEVNVVLVARGVETTFEVRNGVLQHPPHDLEMIRRLFEETNGEFSLLGTDVSSSPGLCVAKVGCYLPARLHTAVAGDAAIPPEESP